MKLAVQLILAVVVLVLGGLAVSFVLSNPRETELVEKPSSAPVVEVLRVERGDHRLSVSSHGEVRPRRMAEVSVELPGRVIELSEDFVVGGFVEEGDVLLRLDARDVEQALVEARGAVASAELRVATEQHEADVAADEWERFGEGTPEPFLLRVPQLAEAHAALDAARARVQRAERDLERSVVRVPFAARIGARSTELGEWLAAGAPVAKLIGIERAEVRLPVPDADLAALELSPRGEPAEGSAHVELSARVGGRRWTWPARLVRTEGEIDPRSRMLTLVAEVLDPYGRGGEVDAQRPPLMSGRFVDAELSGRLLRDVIVVPRAAIRDGGSLAVVDDEQRLRVRSVEPLFMDDDVAVLDAGLEVGERLCLTQLEIVVDGMQVRVADTDTEVAR